MSETLKFGNGQWAVKEGSALAYNDENGNFKPLPFTFDRSTSATRVNKEGLIEVVPNNEPRIDFLNDSKGALKLEPQRSNYILKSDDVLSTYQSQNGDVSDASEPINGFNNSIQIEYDASNSLVYKRDFTPTIGTEYTISLFVQMNDNSEPIHTVDVNSGDFSLINNNSLASASDIKTERLGSTNIYRVSSTRTATSTNNRFGIIKYSTQSSKGFKVTGFQLEQGYLTSYIPTQGSIGTRDAEICNQTPPNGIIGQTEGVIYWEGIINGTENSYGNIITGERNTSTSFSILHNKTPSEFICTVFDGSPKGQCRGGSVVLGEKYKFAYAYKSGDFALYVNGVLVDTSTDTWTPPSTIDNIIVGDATTYFGFKESNTNKQIKFYNTRLTNTELQALTKI